MKSFGYYNIILSHVNLGETVDDDVAVLLV